MKHIFILTKTWAFQTNNNNKAVVLSVTTYFAAEVYRVGKGGKDGTKTHSNIGGFKYRGDGYTVGTPEDPDWEQMLMEKI